MTVSFVIAIIKQLINPYADRFVALAIALRDGVADDASFDYGDIPSDVLHDVLLRLPAKNLGRLRAVCRSWRSLLSDPLFVAAHARVRSVDLDTGAVSIFPDNLHKEQARPRTRRCFCARCAAAVALALGRAASGELKALRISHHFYHQFCEVVSLGDGRWSEAPGPPTTVRTSRRHMAVVNGVAYFLVDAGRLRADFEPGSIASFDLATEQWAAALLRGPLYGNERPPPRRDRRGELTLAALNGHLVAVHHNDEDLTLDLWFRQEEKISDDAKAPRWCRRYAIRYHAVFQMFYENEVEPLFLLDDDRGRVAFWVWRRGRHDGVLRVYDPTCDAAVDVVEITDCVDVGVHTRSLSLGSSSRGNEADQFVKLFS
ncbi:hypothetical protein E2562_032498 [Oryza meyeriana var. granulata]|uniref:F-box domain-containing protein n=1 Tax=Oryza meyeriana var. granulata TaxID=110450 RepID=A0A6G1E6F8_9ORYZ|nr:hypothetical protein E2562_032498 [Oryza meyeriana var. granulata]